MLLLKPELVKDLRVRWNAPDGKERYYGCGCGGSWCPIRLFDLPDVGRGQEILIKDTIKSIPGGGRDGSRAEAGHHCGDFAPCSDVCGLFSCIAGKGSQGDGRFMAPQIGVEAGYDEAFVRELDRLCGG